MSEQELIEKLADAEHASWARWQSYLFSQCLFSTEGDALIPHELVQRWKRQIDTPYKHLSEKEKQSDRDEVAHILPIIQGYFHQHTLKSMRSIVREELAKTLAEREDEAPHIVQVRQDFEAGGTCEYVDWDGKRYKGVLFPVDEADKIDSEN